MQYLELCIMTLYSTVNHDIISSLQVSDNWISMVHGSTKNTDDRPHSGVRVQVRQVGLHYFMHSEPAGQEKRNKKYQVRFQNFPTEARVDTKSFQSYGIPTELYT